MVSATLFALSHNDGIDGTWDPSRSTALWHGGAGADAEFACTGVSQACAMNAVWQTSINTAAMLAIVDLARRLKFMKGMVGGNADSSKCPRLARAQIKSPISAPRRPGVQ